MTKISSPQYLHALATHFSERDWDYTRLHDIKRIRYADDFQGYHTLRKRWGRAFRSLFARSHDTLFGRIMGDSWLRGISYKLTYFKIQVQTDRHLPDGVLNRGSVITHWEEDGEYIQMVQPSVGALLAEFLIDQPDNPWAVKITAELDRLAERYNMRAAAGEVDGRKG